MKPGDLLAAKYRLEHVLGSGGMGEVWAAVNESTGRPVAIKLMYSATPELRARMLREARAGGTLKHENIVDIYDAGEAESGESFLVMERLSGETLADRLDRVGCLPPAAAVEITASIAAALKVAHAGGIVHRDLKPANIFLHREPDGGGEIVKVLDFGVSKHLQETGTITAGVIGSPAYMSPEQANASAIDARSDLWSLGVVLFEMLAGRRPFPSDSPYVVITEVVNGPIPSIAEAVPGLSPALVQVVERCLTRDVDARVGSADELIWMLGSAFDATTGKLPPMPSSVREAEPMRGPSNAVVALVACASALLLILVFGVMLLRVSPTAKTATSATSSAEPAALPEVTNTVVPSSPEPIVAPEAPAAAATSAECKQSGTTPARSAHPRAPARPHPSGEKRLILP